MLSLLLHTNSLFQNEAPDLQSFSESRSPDELLLFASIVLLLKNNVFKSRESYLEGDLISKTDYKINFVFVIN